jgi:hypothetical protein
MTTLVRRTTVATIGAALLFGTVSGTADAADARKPPEATTSIMCEAATSDREDLDHYDGRSASYMYDERFRPGPDLRYSELSQFAPQGLTYWKDWEGKADLLMATAYDTGTRDAIIVGLDPKRNDKSATVGIVQIESNHAGGIALHGDWVYVSDGPHAIRTFKKSALHKAMRESQDSGAEETPKINPVRITKGLYGTSFLTADNGDRKLYAGLFSKKRREWMYRYTIDNSDGSLSLDKKDDDKGLRWEIPARTQGVTLTGGRFIFSSSHDRDIRSNVWVTDRSETNLDKASARCFRAPSLAEGFATDGDTAWLLFESGSDDYNGTNDGHRARNVIDGAHKVKLGDLTSIPGDRIRLGTLHSKNQQDSGGNDEITIKVEDQKLGKNVQIDQGDRKKIGKTVQFTGRVSVKLYERDPESGDDYLGEQTLEPGGGDGIMTFKKRGGHYRLSYKIG